MGKRPEGEVEVLPDQVFTLLPGWQSPCTNRVDGGQPCSGTMLLYAVRGALGPHRNVLVMQSVYGPGLIPATGEIHHHQWKCNACDHWESANMTPQ